MVLRKTRTNIVLEENSIHTYKNQYRIERIETFKKKTQNHYTKSNSLKNAEIEESAKCLHLEPGGKIFKGETHLNEQLNYITCLCVYGLWVPHSRLKYEYTSIMRFGSQKNKNKYHT